VSGVGHAGFGASAEGAEDPGGKLLLTDVAIGDICIGIIWLMRSVTSGR
jgi:hypothetical protein